MTVDVTKFTYEGTSFESLDEGDFFKTRSQSATVYVKVRPSKVPRRHNATSQVLNFNRATTLYHLFDAVETVYKQPT